jgi:hypothetical protein
VHRVLLGIVQEAQLQRIDIGGVGQFIHRDFKQRHAGRGARGAHVARRVGVDAGKRVFAFRVLALVVHQAPVDDDFHVVFELRGGRRGLVDDGLQLAVLVRAERHFLLGFRTVHMAPHLRARHRHAHRALEQLGGHRGQDHLVLRTQAGAEAAAHVRV